MRPAELVVGNCYFSVGYAEPRLAIPLIQTLVYVGHEEDPDNGRQLWTFWEGSSSTSGPGTDEVEDDDVRVVFPEEQLYSILDLGGLMRTLTELAPEHPLHPVPRNPGPASQDDLTGLKAELERFFASLDLHSVTITIRFTDDGLSLVRRPDGRTDLLLVPRPRLQPDREAALRALCFSADLTPTEDYLSDRGRRRILAYPLASGAGRTVAGLASRVFLEVYGMRQGDTLTYRIVSATSEPGGSTA